MEDFARLLFLLIDGLELICLLLVLITKFIAIGVTGYLKNHAVQQLLKRDLDSDSESILTFKGSCTIFINALLIKLNWDIFNFEYEKTVDKCSCFIPVIEVYPGLSVALRRLRSCSNAFNSSVIV